MYTYTTMEATCAIMDATCAIEEATCAIMETTCAIMETTCAIMEATCAIMKEEGFVHTLTRKVTVIQTFGNLRLPSSVMAIHSTPH